MTAVYPFCSTLSVESAAFTVFSSSYARANDPSARMSVSERSVRTFSRSASIKAKSSVN